jgi:hypothetical protein
VHDIMIEPHRLPILISDVLGASCAKDLAGEIPSGKEAGSHGDASP